MNHKLLLIFCLSFVVSGFLFFKIPTAHAATYYVSVADGDDTNCTGLSETAYVSGSAQPCPWKTIAKITSTTFAGGDSILFKRGQTFTGNLQFANETGTSGSRITVGAYGTGDNPILTANGSGRTLDIRNSASYITFENLTLRGAVTDNIFLFNGTFDHLIFQHLDIASSSAFTTNTATTTNTLFSDITIHDVTNGISNINFGTNDTFEDISVTGGVNGISYGSSGSATSTGITINGLSVENTSNYGLRFSKLTGSNISNVTIASTSLYGVYIDLGLEDVTFTNLTISSSTQYGIFLNATGNVTITNATTTSNGLPGASLSGAGVITIENLYSAHNTGSGLTWGSNSGGTLLLSDSVLEYNGANGLTLQTGGFATTTNTVSRYNLNDGFNINNSVHAVFEQTISDTNGVDGTGSDGDGYSWHSISTGSLSRSFVINNKKGGVVNVTTTNVDVFNNVFVHDTTGTLPMINMLDTTVSNIYNNTFYNSSGQGTAIGIGNGATTVTSTVKNNLIYGFDIGIKDATTGTFTESHNWTYNVGTTPFSGFTPDNNSSSTTDPQFTNTVGGDYTLQSTSVAINAGIDVGLTTDYAGNSIMGNPDIGAYEYQWISPGASFSSSRLGTGRIIAFTDNSSDSDDSVIGWSWDFGDGETSSSQNPEHEYSQNGTYTVTLTVTDNHGATNTTTSSVTIDYSNSSGSSHTNLLPNLTFTSTATPSNTSPTIEELKKRITELQNQIAILMGQITGQVVSHSQFIHNLQFHDTGEDVKNLQIFLNGNNFIVTQTGPGSIGNETSYFGTATYQAVKKFQEFYTSEILTPVGLTSGSGFVGLKTREKLNEMIGNQ